MKKKAFRLIMFLFGMTLNSLAVYLVIVSESGTHPIDAIAIGLNAKFGLTIGTWLNINSFLMVLIAALVAKSKIRLICFAVSAGFGFLIDFWGLINIVDVSRVDTLLWYRILLFGAGILINAIGIAIYMSTGYPLSALDNMMVSIKERTKWPLMISRLVMESVLMVIGLLLSGPIGVGTFVIIFAFSYFIDMAYKLINPVYKRIEDRLAD